MVTKNKTTTCGCQCSAVIANLSFLQAEEHTDNGNVDDTVIIKKSQTAKLKISVYTNWLILGESVEKE